MMKVDITELRRVAVEERPYVNIRKVLENAEKLYRAIKLVGIENVTAVYDVKGYSFAVPPVEKKGTEMSKRSRALGAYLMMLEFQMSDSTTSIKRLEKHYGEISLEAALGHIFKKDHVAVKNWSVADVLEKYLGGKYELDRDYDDVWISELHKLVEEKNENVDLLGLWTECENLYKSVIAVGMENTRGWFFNENGSKVVLKGNEISERMRAVVIFVVVNMYRFRDDDVHLKQLEERFMLGTKLKTVLGDTDIFKDRADNLQCISLSNIAGRYLCKESAGKLNVLCPVYMQVPYNALEMKAIDADDPGTIEKMWYALKGFYYCTKLVGIDNFEVSYCDANKKEVVLSGRQVSTRIRAFVEEAVLYMYRMVDSVGSRSRLETHLGLEIPSAYILGDTQVVSCKSASLPCVSLKELIERI